MPCVKSVGVLPTSIVSENFADKQLIDTHVGYVETKASSAIISRVNI